MQDCQLVSDDPEDWKTTVWCVQRWSVPPDIATLEWRTVRPMHCARFLRREHLACLFPQRPLRQPQLDLPLGIPGCSAG